MSAELDAETARDAVLNAVALVQAVQARDDDALDVIESYTEPPSATALAVWLVTYAAAHGDDDPLETLAAMGAGL